MTHHNLIEEKLLAWGHFNVLGTHKSTVELTCASEITQSATCIIGVNATKGLAALSPEFKTLVRSPSTKIEITFESGEKRDIIYAWGDPGLTLTHHHDIVIRKSNFLCARTLAIRANKAAADLDRELIKQLQLKETQLQITILAIKDE